MDMTDKSFLTPFGNMAGKTVSNGMAALSAGCALTVAGAATVALCQAPPDQITGLGYGVIGFGLLGLVFLLGVMLGGQWLGRRQSGGSGPGPGSHGTWDHPDPSAPGAVPPDDLDHELEELLRQSNVRSREHTRTTPDR